MHFNSSEEYRLSPSLDQFGDFQYIDVSETSTYKHPDIHYKLKQDPESVRIVNQFEAGNISTTHYVEIEFMMKQAEGYTAFDSIDPETGEETVMHIGSGSESLFPKWMLYTPIKFNPSTVISEDGEESIQYNLEVTDKYMTHHSYESSYHTLGSKEEFEEFEEDNKLLKNFIDDENWPLYQAFEQLVNKKYDLNAQKDTPVMDLERPLQQEEELIGNYKKYNKDLKEYKRRIDSDSYIKNRVNDFYKTKYDNWLKIYAR